MAGIYTDRRTIKKPLRATRNVGGGTVDLGLNWANVDVIQETTSFRTKGSQDGIRGPEVSNFRKVRYNPFFEDPYNQWDTGHEFRTQKNFTQLSHYKWFCKVNGTPKFFRGPLFLTPTSGSDFVFPTVANMSVNDIKYYGARAIAQTSPLQPAANLAQTVGELLFEGLPFGYAAISSLFERAKYFRSIGSSTLALKFGFEPLIRDTVQIMSAVARFRDILNQYQRDSGQQVRRSYHFRTEDSIISGPWNPGTRVGTFLSLSSGNGFLTPTSGPINLESRIHTKIWFKGAYVYSAPIAVSNLDKLLEFGRKADLVLGVNLTPEVLWELAPWSWLVDWIANVGDAMSNYTRFNSGDNLVLKYGYLMRHTVAVDTYTVSNIGFTDGQKPGTVSRSLITEKKERYKATPFGFGLDPASFNSEQWAILAALGLTKGGRALP